MVHSGKTSLETRDLSIGYHRKGTTDHLVGNGLNLKLRQGELVCLLGPNGSGKSTLIRTLSGLQDAVDGTILINGKSHTELTSRQRARTMSVVLTDSVPMGFLNVYSLVAIGRHPHTNWTGELSKTDRERIEWAIEAVGCQDLVDRHVNELSDGERQKIMIARALAQEAPIMFLDEPTAFLDLSRRVELVQILRDLAHKENLSILLSTHDLEIAMRGADRLWLFGADGSLKQGVPEELALSGTIARTFLSDKLDWDEEHGSFRLHRNSHSFVKLMGEGPAMNWTKRGLLRLGYGISDERESVCMTIEVRMENEQISWFIIMGDTITTFHNLGAFLQWLNEDKLRREDN